MITYNKAYDLYHTIFRLIQLLDRFEKDTVLEIERVRIWDFYLLFPNKVRDIRLKQKEGDVRKLRNQFIKDSKNPYEIVPVERRIFDKLKPYHLSALNCIASYGIIDKASLNQQCIRIINKNILDDFVEELDNVSFKERNVISLMTTHFNQMSLFGKDGLKNRTNLIESKYDA